jgi:hypothetical protein
VTIPASHAAAHERPLIGCLLLETGWPVSLG